MTSTTKTLRPQQLGALLVCAGGGLAWAALNWHVPDRLWSAYLFAFVTCWLVVMGATGLLALGYATGGRWTLVGRPFYSATSQTLPLAAILFLPIAMNLEHIYPWAHESPADAHGLPPATAAYLEQSFFLARAVAYFAVWLIVGGVLNWLARHEPSTPSIASDSRRSRVGAVSLVLLVPTITFAAFDWVMSLEPTWYSSIYGAILTAAGVLAAHALTIIGAAVSAAATEGASPRTADDSNDFGNLLLAFLMVFTYFAFSQFLIIWFGNLPSEVTWYQRRFDAGWGWLAGTIAVLHFVVPFLLLLSRDLKRDPRRLAAVAAWLVVMYALHMAWVILPAIAASGSIWWLTNLAALAMLGGGLLAAACWHVNRHLAVAVRQGQIH